MIIVVKCAQGVVIWKFQRLTPRTAEVRCLQDNVMRTFVSTVTNDWAAGLDLLFAHSVILKGTVQLVFVMPSSIP